MATAGAPFDEPQERTLAQAFARREGWAFEEAYRRYGSLLFSVALNVLAHDEDAEDCVHDTLARVWKKPQTFAADRGSLRGFLVVCVRNDAVSRKRAAQRQERATERIAAQTPSHEELDVADFLEHARVRKALASLPYDQREALTLAYFSGKTQVEIARISGAPLGTVKSRISSGLRKLGALLQAESPS